MVSSFQQYVSNNRLELVRRSTVLEGYMLSKLDTETIINKGVVQKLGFVQMKEVVNLNRAWDWVCQPHTFTKTILEDLHEVISDEVTNYRYLEGYFRSETYEVKISGSSYIPPCVSRNDALNEFGYHLENLLHFLGSNNSTEQKMDECLHFYLYLMKRQFFHDCNKRTSYLFLNYLFNAFDLGCIMYLPKLSAEGTYLKHLKNFYESEDIRYVKQFVTYLKKYYVKPIC